MTNNEQRPSTYVRKGQPIEIAPGVHIAAPGDAELVDLGPAPRLHRSLAVRPIGDHRA